MLRPLALVSLLLASLFAGCATTNGGPLTAEACQLPSTLGLKANPLVTLDTTEGDLVLEIYRNEAPVTANNFLELVRDGHYDGVRFHRVIKDFMIQGGDGSLAGKPDAASIPDEFHRLLRHDAKGTLSMANAGPNTGSDQFFITFGPTTHLDDKHSVFGRLVGGFDVLDKINAEVADDRPANQNDGTPKRAMSIESATIQEQDTAPSSLSLTLASPDADHAVGSAGGDTQFLVVVQNGGDRVVPVCITFTAPVGLSARTEPGWANFDLPARQRVALIVEARADGTSSEDGKVTVTAATVGVTASQELTVRRSASVGPRTAAEGDQVTGNYIGWTVDGRVFDTSVQAVAQAAKAGNLGYGNFQVRSSYQPFSFSPGGNVIQGFTDLAVGTEAGGKTAGRIAPADAYGESCAPYTAQRQQCPALVGRTLLFQLEVVSIA